jgi:hypothetical protein
MPKKHIREELFQEWPDPVSKLISNLENGSDADPGCLSQIPDPNFSIPDPGSRVKKIPDPGSASKNLSTGIFNRKNCF